MNDSELVLVEREGPIGWITLNSPERLNALTEAMLRLDEVLAARANIGLAGSPYSAARAVLSRPGTTCRATRSRSPSRVIRSTTVVGVVNGC